MDFCSSASVMDCITISYCYIEPCMNLFSETPLNDTWLTLCILLAMLIGSRQYECMI